MTDYSKLELRFKKFLHKLEEYRELYFNLLNHPGSPKRDSNLVKKERKMRKTLEQKYGELQANLHGMAGYIMKDIRGNTLDIFLSALDPRLDKNNFIKSLGLEYAIQCLNKAIGSCRYAKSVERTDKQIIIKKGAVVEGLLEIRQILNKSKNTLHIQYRYLSADIFYFIDEIDRNVDIKIIIGKKYQGKATLKTIYKSYRDKEKNVEVRECSKEEFHSRKIIIDNNEGYLLDFSFQDVGKTESYLSKIQDIKTSIEEFRNLWSNSTALLGTENMQK